MKHILIGGPVREEEDTFQFYLKALKNLKIPEGYKVHYLFGLHNSDNLAKYLNEDEYFIHKDDNVEEYRDESTHKWTSKHFKSVVNIKNEIINRAMDYDYLFLVDADVIVDENTLESLITANKDVVAEVFWTQWRPDLPHMPNAWMFDMWDETRVDEFYEPGLYKVGMVGACTLWSQKVLRAMVNFSPIYNVSFSEWEDRAICIRTAVHGFEIWLDTKYPARHLYRRSEVEEYKKWLK